MINLISQQIYFYIALVLVLFVPGYFFMLAVWGKNNKFDSLVKLLISLSSSIIIVDLIMLLLGKTSILINKFSIISSMFLFILLSFGVYLYKKKNGLFGKNQIDKPNNFNKSQKTAIILLLFLSIFIKSIFLSNTIFPTSTDLGHHMYWSKIVTDTGKLPVYEESDVITTGEIISISEPEKIADFIIGEHLIFSAIASLSGADYISYFPSLVLFLINIATVLAIFILTLEIFKNNLQKNNIAILTLLFSGPLYALSSPQAKFVSGGVIGNTIGNFLIPLLIFFFIQSMRTRDKKSFAMTLFLGLGLVYTHHLSTFIFIFIFLFSFLFFFIFNLNLRQINLIKFRNFIFEWTRIIFSPSILSIIVIGLVMIFLVYTPSYLNVSAVDTAVGAPSKSTRTGLSFAQLYSSTGGVRIIFGLTGLLLLIANKKRREYGTIFLAGWSTSLLIMSLWPNLLFIDIPSNRIGSYASFPMAILSAYAFVKIIDWTKNRNSQNSGFFLKNSFVAIIFFAFATFAITGGFVDNSSALSAGGNNEDAVQTFEASSYLAGQLSDVDVVLKDHNYLVADSWIKLFFMQGYNYPLSRGFFKRYEDVIKEREQCTLLMISLPNSSEGAKCFEGTKTNFIMTNPAYDGIQYKKNKDFWKIYESDKISIFHKAN